MRRALMLMVMCSACGPLIGEPREQLDCTAEARPSTQVTVVDADGQVLTDEAEVTYTVDGGEPRPCDALGGGSLACGWEVEGTFEITADALGYEPRTEAVIVESDECHVITEEVRLELQATDCDDAISYGVEVRTVAQGDPVAARVQWVSEVGFTDCEPIMLTDESFTYGCAPEVGGELQVIANNADVGSWEGMIDVPVDDCGPITQQVTAVLR